MKDAKQPNILLILSRGHHWQSGGFALNPDVQTPNLNALAKHGLCFPQAVCQFPDPASSHATVFTGQYPSRHGVYGEGDLRSMDCPFLSNLLNEGGYTTGAVGGIFPKDSEHFDIVRDVLPEDAGSEMAQSFIDSFGAWPSSLAIGQHPTTQTGNEAVRFIQAARDPFFLCVSFDSPGYPFTPPLDWVRQYDPEALTLSDGFRLPIAEEDRFDCTPFDYDRLTERTFRRVLAHYYAAIGHMGDQIGRVLATVGSRGHTNNVLLYSSTQGEYMGQHGLIFGDGGPPYDSLLRIPMIGSGVLGQRTGEADDTPVELTDVMPSLLEIAGIEIPESVQGMSLLPRLSTRGGSLRKSTYSETTTTRIARNKRYKLVESFDAAQRRFTDLEVDPHEFENRSGQRETVREQVELVKTLRRIR
jgi:arylsulfatase